LHAVTNLYVDNSITLGSNQPIFESLHIKERNFYDEKNEPEKLDEVVSAILRYLGLTLIQYKNNFYIINQEKTRQQSFSVRVYQYSSGAWHSYSTGALSITSKSFSQIGLAADDTTISLDSVYNKVTVIANNNPLSSVLPDFDDTDDLVNQHGEPSYYATESYTGQNGTNYTLVSGFFKSDENWNYAPPVINGSAVSEVTINNRDSLTGGVFWQKVFDYETGYEPSSPDWHTYITMCGSYFYYPPGPMLSLQNTQSMILDGGYLIVNLKYKLSTENKAHSVVSSRYDSFSTFGYCSDLMWDSNSDHIGNGRWPNNTMFPAKITIGDWLFNGETWISQTQFAAKRTHWNTLYSGWGIDMSGGEKYWYALPDSVYNDELEFVPKSVYDASNNAMKQTGKCATANASKLYHRTYNEWIYISEEFYNKYYYGDRCFLTHINKTNEAIYDVEYSLTNTVSYKFNIVDATDGVAIPCPTNKSMYGNLTFDIYSPINSLKSSILGYNPQYRSDHAATTCKAVHISDLSIQYKKSTDYKDIFSSAKVDPDTLYHNTVNGSYCKECDDITLEVNTANDWATSYSYAIAQSGNEYYYIKGVRFDGVQKKPEERLVERLVNHYKIPKYKMTATVHDSVSVQPFHPITETINGQTKQMVANSVTYHLSANTVTIEANEI